MAVVTKNKTLKGKRLIELWRSGSEEWNLWVENNRDWELDFSGVDFDDYLSNGESLFFEDYVLPSGGIRFKNVNFGKRDVLFGGVNFGIGEVSFEGAVFKKGRISFSQAKFGDCGVNFTNVSFGDGDVDFMGARFGDGGVTFLASTFGIGYVRFTYAKFGEGDADFQNVDFGDGDVIFREAKFRAYSVCFNNVKFGSGIVVFSGVDFGESSVSFEELNFGGGDVVFHGARFQGNTIFRKVIFGEGDVGFIATKFIGNHIGFEKTDFGGGEISFIGSEFSGDTVDFYECKFGGGKVRFRYSRWDSSCVFNSLDLHECEIIDFSSSTFNSELSLINLDSPVVIDLRHTKLTRPIDLDSVNIEFRKESHNVIFNRAESIQDSTCFRRLKKLAQDAADHQRALDFFAKEMRSAYWYELRGPKLILYYLYDLFSNYGRSIFRPTIGLVSTWGFFSLFYYSMKTRQSATLLDGGVFSLGHTIPIYSGTRDARSDSIEALFYGVMNVPSWLHFVTVLQGVVSAVFIFLIALAIRNLYRS